MASNGVAAGARPAKPEEIVAAIDQRILELQAVRRTVLIALAQPIGAEGQIRVEDLPQSWRPRTNQRHQQLEAEAARQQAKQQQFRSRRKKGNVTAVILATMQQHGRPIHISELWKLVSRNNSWTSRSADRKGIFLQSLYNLRKTHRVEYADDIGNGILRLTVPPQPTAPPVPTAEELLP